VCVCTRASDAAGVRYQQRLLHAHTDELLLPHPPQGICIAKRNRSVRSSFTLRNIFGGSGGIERTFPLYSPHITEMKVLESRRVRRAKLYYLRERTAKEYRT
jgi:ribosomal protein L19